MQPLSGKHIHISQKFVTFFQRSRSLSWQTRVFRQYFLVVSFVRIRDIVLGMKKLAPVSVGTEAGLVDLIARLCLKVGGKVLLFHKFMLSVRERTLVLKMTLPSQFPVPAHLRLKLHLVRLHEVFSLLFIAEVLLRLFDSGHLVCFLRIVFLFRILIIRLPRFLFLEILLMVIVACLSGTIGLVVEWVLPRSYFTIILFCRHLQVLAVFGLLVGWLRLLLLVDSIG